MTRLWTPLLLALFLTACATAGSGDGPGEDDAPRVTETAEGTTDTPAEPAPPPPPPQPKPVFDPDVFSGLTGPALEARYGAPRLIRRDDVAQVWQYLEGDCVLHLFLYAVGDGADAGLFRVEHAEAKLRRDADNPDLTAAAACAGPFGVIKSPGVPEVEQPAGLPGNAPQTE